MFLSTGAGYTCYTTDHAMGALMTSYCFAPAPAGQIELIEGRRKIDKPWDRPHENCLTKDTQGLF